LTGSEKEYSKKECVLLHFVAAREQKRMWIFLTTFTAAVLLLRIPTATLRGVPATTQETVSAKQAAPNLQGGTRKPYACSAPVGGPLSKPTREAASQQVTGKDKATREFCLELDQPQTVVGEYLRSVLGDTGWALPTSSLEKSSGLRATRSLSAEELRRTAQTEIGGGKIQWEEGGANVEIRLIPRSGGGTQIRVRARILGKGSTSLRLMRMSPWWPLASTGALEGDILAALEARYNVRP
jgi:hypothetical protein